MKLRFPLYAKILVWFFLNLIFLGVAFYVVFKVQFRLGLDSLLAGRAGEHLQSVSEVIGNELNQSPNTEWDDLLKRFSSAYHVQFYLFRDDGPQMAGEPVDLPGPVFTKLTDRRGPPLHPAPRGPLSDDGLGPSEERGPPDGPEMRDGNPRWPEGPPPGARAGRPRFGALPRDIQRGPHPRFMVHTAKPGRYWVLVRLQVNDGERPRPVPATLVAMSSSIRGGGLFFDFIPWAWVGFAVLFVSVLFWFPLVRGITRYISQMTQATEAIAEGRFDAPVQSERGDELGRLSQAIHRMAARLSGFVHGQKRFLGDIAHELCSPIARMQVALGILEERADPKQKAYVEDVREEVQHMSSLVNELLSFSKAGLSKQPIKLEPVRVETIARRVVARETGGANPIEVQVDGSVQVLAEPELLSRALANLVRNALRYAGDAGPVTISASVANGQVTVGVADCGPGVPAEKLEQIFDPFFRLEASRSRDTGGIGLGLSIVKTCVEACRGTVTARNRRPSGLLVEIVLSEASAGSSSLL